MMFRIRHLATAALCVFTCLAASGRADAAVVTVRSDGTFLVDGKPFFPIGGYFVGWSASADKLLTDLRGMAAAGFNFMHASQTASNNYPGFLDEAARLGVMVMTEFGGDKVTAVNQLKGKPAVFGWSIADDAHDHYTAAQITSTNSAIKAADPNHVTYLTVYDKSKWGPYMALTDCVGPYYYPVSAGPLNLVDITMSAARATGRPLIGIPQAFTWGGQRTPTGAESRNMTYQNVINHVKGILYYAYYDGGNYLPNTPDMWNDIKKQIVELKTLSPVLCDGKYTRVNTGSATALAAYWEYNGQVYVICINTAYSGDANFSITLPSGVTGTAQPVFSGRPSGMSVSSGKLVGTVKPTDVHVYVIGAGTPPANKPPTVSITSPASGASYTAPASITLTANAGDPDGSVAKLEWFANGTLLASETASPYTLAWNNVAAGSYSVTAKVTDNQGATATSAAVNVTVAAPGTGPATGAGRGLDAEYYDNPDFTNLKVTRVDPTVNFDWTGKSPDPSMVGDTYSVRWTGQVQPLYTETYTFTTLSDDGVRLWVNGQLLVDNWTLHAATENKGTIALTAGQKYSVKMEYYQAGGNAVAKLSWSSAHQALQVIPQSQLYPVGGNGVKGEYFADTTLSSLKLTRIDPTIDFDWGTGSPGAPLPTTNYSVRWTGTVQPRYSETYTFTTASDDGVRLWVNGQQLVNNWTDHGTTENSGTISLLAGLKYDIRMEYYQKGGGAVAKLYWASATQPRQIVPADRLFPQSKVTVEAERLSLSNYVVEANSAASGGSQISLSQTSLSGSTGTASGTFSGESGTYDIYVAYFDENDGTSHFDFRLNGAVTDSWDASAQLGSGSAVAANRVVRKVASGVSVTKGMSFSVTGTRSSNELARVDYLQFVPR